MMCDDHTWAGQGECPECKANDEVAFRRAVPVEGDREERIEFVPTHERGKVIASLTVDEERQIAERYADRMRLEFVSRAALAGVSLTGSGLREADLAVIRRALRVGQVSYDGDGWYAKNAGLLNEDEDGDVVFTAAFRALSGESGEPKPFRCPHVPSCCPLDPDSAPYTEVGESGEPKARPVRYNRRHGVGESGEPKETDWPGLQEHLDTDPRGYIPRPK